MWFPSWAARTRGRSSGNSATRIILAYSLALRVPTETKNPRDLFGKTGRETGKEETSREKLYVAERERKGGRETGNGNEREREEKIACQGWETGHRLLWPRLFRYSCRRELLIAAHPL